MTTTSARGFQHVPVMLAEVLVALAPRPGGIYIDATLGGAGHAAALLQCATPAGLLVGVDADPEALAAAEKKLHALVVAGLGGDYRLCHGHFDQLTALLQDVGVTAVDGILFDLGVSSHQLDTPARGFSFGSDGPLDMRLDPTQGPTAADLLAELDEHTLADIIFRYGEERASRHIARRIVEQRHRAPLTTTSELASLVARTLHGERGRIHPATRTFQALRIAVNNELERLERALPQAVALLKPGGRLAVISFHSLEDRIVKYFFRAEAHQADESSPSPRLRIITKKPLEASDAEQHTNVRSRSAKLRVAERRAEWGMGKRNLKPETRNLKPEI